MEKKINSGTRLASMLLDHVIMTFAIGIVCVPFILYNIMHVISAGDFDGNPFTIYKGITGYIMVSAYGIYFLKDSFSGRSIAKRILKLQVVNNITGLPATPLQCFVRNLFTIIWPIEGIVALINTSRRIGDYVAGTRLVAYDVEKNAAYKSKYLQIPVAALLSFSLMLAFGFSMKTLIKSMLGMKYEFVKSSYNPDESIAISKLFNDSLGEYSLSEVKVYDKVVTKNYKYAIVKLSLKEKYVFDDDSKEQIIEKSKALLFSRFSKKELAGAIRLVYKNGDLKNLNGGILTINTVALDPERK